MHATACLKLWPRWSMPFVGTRPVPVAYRRECCSYGWRKMIIFLSRTIGELCTYSSFFWAGKEHLSSQRNEALPKGAFPPNRWWNDRRSRQIETQKSEKKSRKQKDLQIVLQWKRHSNPVFIIFEALLRMCPLVKVESGGFAIYCQCLIGYVCIYNTYTQALVRVHEDPYPVLLSTRQTAGLHRYYLFPTMQADE